MHSAGEAGDQSGSASAAVGLINSCRSNINCMYRKCITHAVILAQIDIDASHM